MSNQIKTSVETAQRNHVESGDLLAVDNQLKVHTSNLLAEIVNCSGVGIYKIPISIFGKLLAAVGERAAELNDPKLNALMCRLTIYTIADPKSPDFDQEKTREILKAANIKADSRDRESAPKNL